MEDTGDQPQEGGSGPQEGVEEDLVEIAADGGSSRKRYRVEGHGDSATLWLGPNQIYKDLSQRAVIVKVFNRRMKQAVHLLKILEEDMGDLGAAVHYSLIATTPDGGSAQEVMSEDAGKDLRLQQLSSLFGTSLACHGLIVAALEKSKKVRGLLLLNIIIISY